MYASMPLTFRGFSFSCATYLCMCKKAIWCCKEMAGPIGFSFDLYHLPLKDLIIGVRKR